MAKSDLSSKSHSTKLVKKITLAAYGAASAKTLVLTEEAQELTAQEGEVIVEVAYSGINFADIIMRLGFYPDAPPKPFVPGYEISGIVREVGTGVVNVAVGDEVMSGCFFGGYSSYLKLPAWQVIKKPTYLSMAQAAGLPVSFITLHTALFEMARIRPHDDVLIDCATGGLGTIAMQMVKIVGARGVGLTSSPHKKALIENHGFDSATHEEFHSGQRFRDRKFDIIINSQGGASIKQHFSRLDITGRLVALGISSGVKGDKRRLLPLMKSLWQTPRFSMIRLMNDSKGVFGLNALRLMQDQDKSLRCAKAMAKIEGLIPHIGQTYPAEEVVAAHKLVESRQSQGKTLLAW